MTSSFHHRALSIRCPVVNRPMGDHQIFPAEQTKVLALAVGEPATVSAPRGGGFREAEDPPCPQGCALPPVHDANEV